MSFYSDMATLATDMISEYGRPMVLRSYVVSGTAYEPTRTETDTTIHGVFTGFSTKDIDGTLIKAEDKMCLVDASIIPEKANTVVDGGIVYEVVNVMEIKPGDTGILYKLHVRK